MRTIDPTAPGIGSPAWLEQTRGALSGRDLRVSVAGGLAIFARDVPSQLRVRLSRGEGIARTLDFALVLPETGLVRRAMDAALEVYRPVLLQHSLRTWAWAELFRQREGLSADPETLFLACLLHDMTLGDALRTPAGEGCLCFAGHGAHLAHDLLTGLGAPAAMAEEVAAAIGYHLNTRVPPSAGAVSHLLHAGAGLDVAGLRAGDLGRSALARVLGRYPRQDVVAALRRELRIEAAERPDSRAAVLWRYGIRIAMALNPLDGIEATEAGA